MQKSIQIFEVSVPVLIIRLVFVPRYMFLKGEFKELLQIFFHMIFETDSAASLYNF